MDKIKDVAELIGRIFLSFIFLYEAYDSIAFFDNTKERMAHYGITWQPDFLLYSAIVLLVLGGILLLLGYRTGFGVSLLLIYYVPVTFIVHSFWNDPPEIQREQSILFMNNIAIIGGLLIMWSNKSRRWAIKRLFATTKVG